MKILVTGGTGFIGGTVIRYIIEKTTDSVVNVDKLTDIDNLGSLADIENSDRYSFCHVDICDQENLQEVFDQHQPDAVMHLAANCPSTQSNDMTSDLLHSNIMGTHTLLEVSRHYWLNMSEQQRSAFRFHHISTDEVYGNVEGGSLYENAAYAPSLPYSASKASSDLLVKAWHRTFGLPVIISIGSNTYGPYQPPTKLIPHTIVNAIQGKPIPVYGAGVQIRNWICAEDHAKALYTTLMTGGLGETYHISGSYEKRNLELVEVICDILNQLKPHKPNDIKDYRELITFTMDPPGHDRRRSIHSQKIHDELGWCAEDNYDSRLILKTVEWYVSNEDWWQRILDRDHLTTQY